MENAPALQRRGIKFKDKLGYALGDFGCQLSFALIGSFQQMFYTDVLRIPFAQIAVLMMAARIWDAINDPIWGAIVDRRKPSKHGRFRPYLLWISLPIAIMSVLMFTYIPNLSSNQYLLFAYVTYIAYGMLYTGVNIPYGSLASVITDDPQERASLSMFRSLGAGVGALPAQILLPLFVYSSAVEGGAKYLDAGKLTTAVAILAGFSLIIYFFAFKMTKERVPATPTQKNTNVLHTIGALLKNRPFLALCLASMLLIAAQLYTQTVYNYLYKDYFSAPELYSLVTISTYAPMALLTLVLGKLVRRFGKKSLCAAGLLLASVSNLLAWIIGTGSPYVFLVFCFFSGLGTTFFVMEVWAMVTDVIDYHEFLTGRREEGTSYAFFSFTRKLGQTVAGSGGAAVLGLIGYNVDKANAGIVQSAEVVGRIYSIATAIPAAIFLLIFLVLVLLYPLGKQQIARLQQDLQQRRQVQA